MKARAGKSSSTVPDHSLFAIVFSLLGWALLAYFLVVHRAGLIPHAVSSLSALCLVMVSISRYRRCRHQQQVWKSKPMAKWLWTRGINVRDAAWSILLLIVGSLLGALVLLGWALPLFAAAVGILCLPWSRAHFYYRSFPSSCVLVLAGAAGTLAAGHRGISLMSLPISCWALWICACGALLGDIEKSWRSSRNAGPHKA